MPELFISSLQSLFVQSKRFILHFLPSYQSLRPGTDQTSLTRWVQWGLWGFWNSPEAVSSSQNSPRACVKARQQTCQNDLVWVPEQGRRKQWHKYDIPSGEGLQIQLKHYNAPNMPVKPPRTRRDREGWEKPQKKGYVFCSVLAVD